MFTQEQIKEHRRELVEALRSGKYKKTETRLYDPYDKGFCCLGVACAERGIDLTELGLHFRSISGSRSMGLSFCDLTHYIQTVKVAEYYGFDKGTCDRLANLNDKSETFKPVIAYIEQELL